MRSLPLTEAGREPLRTSIVSGPRTRAAHLVRPRIMNLPVLRTIEVDDEVVKLTFDWMGAERLVHLDQAGHPPLSSPVRKDIRSATGRATRRHRHRRVHPEPDGLRLGVAFRQGRASIGRTLSLTEDRLQLQYELRSRILKYFQARRRSPPCGIIGRIPSSPRERNVIRRMKTFSHAGKARAADALITTTTIRRDLRLQSFL